MYSFGGTKILWLFFGPYQNWISFRVFFLCILRYFLKVIIQNRDNFLVCKKFNFFLDACYFYFFFFFWGGGGGGGK